MIVSEYQAQLFILILIRIQENYLDPDPQHWTVKIVELNKPQG